MVKNRIVRILFVLLSMITISAVCNAQARVKGYYRKGGAYVHPHVRSNPDGNPYNNWSYPGNVNPYIGKVATGNPEIYLKKYWEDGDRFFRDNKPIKTISNTQRRVSANVLNARPSPSVNSSMVGKLNYSDVVEVYGLHRDWAFVKYRHMDLYYKVNTLEGYVSTKYSITRLVY